MSASTATLPNRAAPAGSRPDHRPLSAIAAAAGGGVPQARIRRVLADLAVPLAQLHAQGRVHGAVAMNTIGLDTSGQAHLLVPPLEPAADAEGGVRFEGYAAFEQYTDDPQRPCGPWTDIYALSAVAHTMLVGAAPPAALARCVKDTYAPLAGRDLGAYDDEFLQAVDRGLAMTPSARPQSIEDFIPAFGLGVSLQPPAAEPLAAEAAEAPELPPVAAPPKAEPGPRVPLLVMLGLLAAVALAVYLWLRPGAPGSRPADGDAAPAPAATPAPSQEPVPTPPALSDLGAPRAATPATPATPAPPASPAPQAAIPAAPGGPGSVPDSAGTPGPQPGAAATLPGDATPAPGVPQDTAPAGQAPSAAVPPDRTGLAAPQAGESAAVPPAAPAASAPQAVVPSGGEAGAAADAAPASPGLPDATAPDAAAGAAAPADPAAGSSAAEVAQEPPEETPPPAASMAVRVHVQPWGEVLVDGRSRGISPPLTELTLSPGRHRVTIRNPAAPDYHTTINVGAGESAAISHVFE